MPSSSNNNVALIRNNVTPFTIEGETHSIDKRQTKRNNKNLSPEQRRRRARRRRQQVAKKRHQKIMTQLETMSGQLAEIQALINSTSTTKAP
uniref:BZIP domain-containing protein n=1 Tax=Parastrongyloides trichosuri TaxID=131310 RepID=A0A0N4ZDZ6_PARTI